MVTSAELRLGDLGGDKSWCYSVKTCEALILRELNVGALNVGCLHPSCNTDQGVKQTRKGEDIVASTSLVLKGCDLSHGVHTKRMPNTVRPPVG